MEDVKKLKVGVLRERLTALGEDSRGVKKVLLERYLRCRPDIITTLPTDVLEKVLVQLGHRKGRARDLARTAPTCRAFRDAARLAEQAHRRVCYEGHTNTVRGVAAARDGRVITGSYDKTIKVWRNGACEDTIHAQ